MCTSDKKKGVAGCGTICTLALQIIYCGLYGYYHLRNPDKYMPGGAGEVDTNIRAHCCGADKNAFEGYDCADAEKMSATQVDATALYLMYFKVMFFMCLVGIATSGLMIFACCCECLASPAALLNFLTNLAQLAMLVFGSIWRF